MPREKVEKICERLSSNEAFIVTSDAARLYLTGFSSSAGALVLTHEKAYFLIDFRYFEKASATVDCAEVMLSNRFMADASKLLTACFVKTLFFETSFVTLSGFERFKLGFQGFDVSTDSRYDDILKEQRSIKSRDEIENIAAAQKLTDMTFSYILDRIKPGQTERDIMLDMEFYMRSQGSEGVSFDFIVVSGSNSSMPHGVPTKKKVEKGDFITMDFGAIVNGYHSDMTRTIALGAVSDEQKSLYNRVLESQKMAIAAVKPGAVCKNIDKIARDYINKEYNGCFGHGLGHSVGVEIHENPCFNTTCETLLEPGMVITVEPGIYLAKRFGVRIEDMVVVTENGCDDITESPKELIII